MKRILSLLIAIAMLAVAVSLVACGGDPEVTTSSSKTTSGTTASSSTAGTTASSSGSDSTTASSGSTSASATTGGTTSGGNTGSDELNGKTKHPDFMDVNFNGREFVFAIQNVDDWDEYDIAPEATGEDNIITEASITRTKTVEALYNCKIKEIKCDTNSYGLISTDIQTGKHTVDFAEYQYSLTKANSELVNYGKLDIDFTHDWFDQKLIDTLNVNDDGVNRFYQLSGAWNLISYDASWMLYFNMNVYEQLVSAGKTNIDLYQTVKDGKWTVDVMLSLMEQAKNDVNGDQKMSYDDGDVFGLTTYANGYINNALWFGIGGRGAVRDTATNKLTAISKDNTDIAALSAAIDAAAKIVNNESYTGISSIAGARASFTNGQALFSSECLQAASLVTDENANFSCVPFPKYNESQEDYYTMVCNRAYALGTSAAISDLNNIANFLEVFAFHSQKLVYPEYVNYYKTQVFCDDGAGEMLDIVFRSRVWDLDYFGNMGITSTVAGYISTGKNMFSKAIASKSNATNNLLDSYRSNVKKVADQ